MLAVTVEAAALKKIIPAMKSLGLSRTTIPVLQCVKLEARNATLEIMATNLDSNVRMSVPANGEGVWCLSFAKLQAVLSSIPDGALIGISGDSIATITAGKIKATIASFPTVDFPDWAQAPTDNPIISIPAAELLNALKAVSWATDDHRTDIKGVHLYHPGGNAALRLEATNGHVVSRMAVVCEAREALSFILPQYAAAEISSLTGDIEIFSDTKTIAIRAGGLVWTSKLLDATYPDIDRLITGHGTGKTRQSVFDVKALAVAAKGASGMDPDTAKSIQLLANPNGSFVTGFGDTGEKFTIPIDCECGDAFEAWLNPEYLSGVLASCGSETIEMARAPSSLHLAGKNYTALIMTLRDSIVARRAA